MTCHSGDRFQKVGMSVFCPLSYAWGHYTSYTMSRHFRSALVCKYMSMKWSRELMFSGPEFSGSIDNTSSLHSPSKSIAKVSHHSVVRADISASNFASILPQWMRRKSTPTTEESTSAPSTEVSATSTSSLFDEVAREARSGPREAAKEVRYRALDLGLS
jgi:hypothetical protein